jgi:DeoR/GlpR family transcriptional regulator of sugar metabolism
MAAARQVTVLADHSKFDRMRTLRVVPMERISRVVTDSGTSEEHLEALRGLGIAVNVV